jgi:acetolactate synthase-1/2/3 large subunit
MEILVAVKERLPILFAVFNDARYNMVYHGFRQVFDREVAWDCPWVDFAQWAHSLQIPARQVNHPHEITARVVHELTANGPGLLDIRVDRDIRFAGGGRNEALQHMSVLAGASAQVRGGGNSS